MSKTNTFNTKRFSAVIEKAIKNGHQVFFKTKTGSKLVVSWDENTEVFVYDVFGSSAYLIKGKYKIKGTYTDLYSAIANTLSEYQRTKGNVLVFEGAIVDNDVHYVEQEERIFIGKYRVNEEEFLKELIFAREG